MILQDLRWPLDAEVVAERILNVCAEPYLAKGQELFLSGSIGITIYPDDAEELEILMRNADAAMYRDEKTTSIIQEIHDMKWLGLFTSNRRKLF